MFPKEVLHKLCSQLAEQRESKRSRLQLTLEHCEKMAKPPLEMCVFNSYSQ